MGKNVLVTNNLTKKYKDFVALDNVNITIKQGDIYGLIGRNGAGKTTLMRLVTTLTTKTRGSFTLFENTNEGLTAIKKRIGCLIETPAFFSNLNAYDNLKYYAIQKKISDFNNINDSLDLVGLNDTGKKKYKNFSLGMKQRLGIALAILDNPEFIILDEPINGLDPIGISELRDTFKRLSEEKNMTILISSHILSELYLVATKFGFIEKGKLIKELTKEELDIECNKSLAVETNDSTKAANILEKELNIEKYTIIDKSELRIYDNSISPSKVNKVLVKNDIEVSGLHEFNLSLEDYFKSIIKEDMSNE
jgi:ABC-type multidrug transport system, ATPase component